MFLCYGCARTRNTRLFAKIRASNVQCQVSSSLDPNASGFGQVEEIRKVWALFDQDGSGSIDVKELGSVVKQLSGGAEVKPHEIEALMNKMDKNGDGSCKSSESPDLKLNPNVYLCSCTFVCSVA